MGAQEFSDCVANRLGTTGDFILNAVTTMGEENVKKFLNFWSRLSTQNQTLILAIATSSGIPAVKFILVKALGGPVGEALALGLATLLASFSLGALVTSMALCGVDQL